MKVNTVLSRSKVEEAKNAYTPVAAEADAATSTLKPTTKASLMARTRSSPRKFLRGSKGDKQDANNKQQQQQHSSEARDDVKKEMTSDGGDDLNGREPSELTHPSTLPQLVPRGPSMRRTQTDATTMSKMVATAEDELLVRGPSVEESTMPPKIDVIKEETVEKNPIESKPTATVVETKDQPTKRTRVKGLSHPPLATRTATKVATENQFNTPTAAMSSAGAAAPEAAEAIVEGKTNQPKGKQGDIIPSSVSEGSKGSLPPALSNSTPNSLHNHSKPGQNKRTVHKEQADDAITFTGMLSGNKKSSNRNRMRTYNKKKLSNERNDIESCHDDESQREPAPKHIWPQKNNRQGQKKFFVYRWKNAVSVIIIMCFVINCYTIGYSLRLDTERYIDSDVLIHSMPEISKGYSSLEATQPLDHPSENMNEIMASLLGGSEGYAVKNRMWAVKSALDRLDQEVSGKETSQHNQSHRSRKIGLFFQLGDNIDLLPDMTMCLANVASAMLSSEMNLSLDLHVALQKKGQMETDISQFFSKLLSVSIGPSSVYTVVTPIGGETGAFLSQIHNVVDKNVHYDLLLKIHAESDPILRERIVESLCGTPEQVQSILFNMFNKSTNSDAPTLIAPHGTVFFSSTFTSEVFPHLLTKYGWPSFDASIVKEMNNVKRIFDGTQEDFEEANLSSVGGACYWANNFGSLQKSYLSLKAYLTESNETSSAAERVVERVITSLILTHEDGRLVDIQPAPRPIALYFPQYHKIPENDRFWGENFTEWTLLRGMKVPADRPPLKKPISRKEGGLGYYNLEEYDTRHKQAEIARHFGVQGFCYYHYWFSGDRAPKNHLVMGKIPEAMLRDGQPNVNFMLSWANEPWTRRWDGGNRGVLLSQTYGDEDEWLEHYEYLLPFFKHEKYIQVNGAPVFAIYRSEHMGELIEPMTDFWQSLSRERGDFPNGLHIIQTIIQGWTNKATHKKDVFQGSFQFFPSVYYKPQFSSSHEDVPLANVDQSQHIQYWGGFVGFDRRPRVPSTPGILLRSPEKFQRDLCETTFPMLASYRNRNIATNLFFITAWNEWNEQAVLEPNAIDGFEYLLSLKYCLNRIPALQVTPAAEQYTFCESCSAEWGKCNTRIQYLRDRYKSNPTDSKSVIMKEGKCLQKVPFNKASRERFVV